LDHSQYLDNLQHVVSDPNVVIKCKKNHHTLGTIPKSTTSILVAWYRYFNVNEQKFQASQDDIDKSQTTDIIFNKDLQNC
jgi:hypothetical protein